MGILSRFVRIGSEKSEWLLLTGVYYILFGLANILIPETETKSRIFSWLPTDFNANELAWIWLLVGVYVTLSIVLRREPPKYLTGPITAAIIPPMVWSIIFFVAAFGYGIKTALSVALTYAFIAAAMILISGHLDHLIEVAKVRKPTWKG